LFVGGRAGRFRTIRCGAVVLSAQIPTDGRVGP
jgi:hypothetical protein